jgi:hypothetical protein
MTDEISLAAGDACTLPTAERPLRQKEFDALFTAVRTVDRLSPGRLRLALAVPPGMTGFADAVLDLTVRESQCCSFFDFTVAAADPERVELTIAVPPAYVTVLDALVARIGAVR